jgi:hypothetical protein
MKSLTSSRCYERRYEVKGESPEYRMGYSDGANGHSPAMLGGVYMKGYKKGCFETCRPVPVRVRAPIQEKTKMKPSIGRIVHYNVSGKGWRPFMITGVYGPHEAIDGSMNPLYVSGWVKLDPNDLLWGRGGQGPTYEVNDETFLGREHPVSNAYEGEREGNWRWPPRV